MSEVFQQTLADKCTVETGCGEKGVPWKDLGNNGKRTICTGNVGIFSPRKRQSKKFRELAEEEKQAGIQGQWQLESPAREHMEQVKCGDDTYCRERMMKKG